MRFATAVCLVALILLRTSAKLAGGEAPAGTASILDRDISRSLSYSAKPISEVLSDVARMSGFSYSIEQRLPTDTGAFDQPATFELKNPTLRHLFEVLRSQSPHLQWRESDGIVNFCDDRKGPEAHWVLDDVLNTVDIRTNRIYIGRRFALLSHEIIGPTSTQLYDDDVDPDTFQVLAPTIHLISEHSSIRELLNQFVRKSVESHEIVMWQLERGTEGKSILVVRLLTRLPGWGTPATQPAS